MVAIPPAAEARNVLVATEPIKSHLPTAPKVEPGLNPNHPNQRIKAPTADKVKLCPGIALAVPSSLYFPRRGPKTIAPASAANPPIA